MLCSLEKRPATKYPAQKRVSMPVERCGCSTCWNVWGLVQEQMDGRRLNEWISGRCFNKEKLNSLIRKYSALVWKSSCNYSDDISWAWFLTGPCCLAARSILAENELLAFFGTMDISFIMQKNISSQLCSFLVKMRRWFCRNFRKQRENRDGNQ